MEREAGRGASTEKGLADTSKWNCSNDQLYRTFFRQKTVLRMRPKIMGMAVARSFLDILRMFVCIGCCCVKLDVQDDSQFLVYRLIRRFHVASFGFLFSSLSLARKLRHWEYS